MSSQDFRDLEQVFREGARSILGWPDPGVAGTANALISMADKCRDIARKREQEEK